MLHDVGQVVHQCVHVSLQSDVENISLFKIVKYLRKCSPVVIEVGKVGLVITVVETYFNNISNTKIYH